MNGPPVDGLLEASIAGAGLVLAAYTLVAQNARRIFEERGAEARKAAEDLKCISNAILNPEVDSKGSRTPAVKLEELQQNLGRIGSKIAEASEFPDYMSVGFGASFFAYLVSALACPWWEGNQNVGLFSLVAFSLATGIFLLVGIRTIYDINRIMRSDFNECREQLTSFKEEQRSAKSIIEKERQIMEKAKELAVAHLLREYSSVRNPKFISVGRPIGSDKDEVTTEGLFDDQHGTQHYFKIKVVDGKAIEVRTT